MIYKLTLLGLCLLMLTLTECKTSSKSTKSTTSATTTSAPVPAEPKLNATDPVVTAIAIGESVYQAKCVDCHKLPVPSEYNHTEWADIMVKMSRKAHLSDTETSQVLAYVNASAKK